MVEPSYIGIMEKKMEAYILGLGYVELRNLHSLGSSWRATELSNGGMGKWKLLHCLGSRV